MIMLPSCRLAVCISTTALDRSSLGHPGCAQLSAKYYATLKPTMFKLPAPTDTKGIKKKRPTCYFSCQSIGAKITEISKRDMVRLMEEDDGKVTERKDPSGDMKLWTKSQVWETQPINKADLESFFSTSDAAEAEPCLSPPEHKDSTSMLMYVETFASPTQPLLMDCLQETQQVHWSTPAMDVDNDVIPLEDEREPFNLKDHTLSPHRLLLTLQTRALSSSVPPHGQLDHSLRAAANLASLLHVPQYLSNNEGTNSTVRSQHINNSVQTISLSIASLEPRPIIMSSLVGPSATWSGCSQDQSRASVSSPAMACSSHRDAAIKYILGSFSKSPMNTQFCGPDVQINGTSLSAMPDHV
jgi:hypothetical protein